MILAAVIGTFVLGLGDKVQRTSPQANFVVESYDGDDDNDPDAVIFTHDGGDTFQPDRLRVKVGGDTSKWGEEVSAGDDFIMTDGGGASVITEDVQVSIGDVSGTTFRLVYSSPDGGSTTLYREFTAD